MKIQSLFKTKKEATKYLTTRDWQFKAKTFGQDTFTHSEFKNQCRVICKLRNKAQWWIDVVTLPSNTPPTPQA